jgi:hypothetical protein
MARDRTLHRLGLRRLEEAPRDVLVDLMQVGLVSSCVDKERQAIHVHVSCAAHLICAHVSLCV